MHQVMNRIGARAIIVSIAVLLAAPFAFGQLAQNGTSTKSVNFTTGALSTTVAHTTPAFANRLMIVAVHMNINNSTGTTVSGITYNGTALTFGQGVNDGSDNTRTEQWFLIAPPTGNHNVVVTVQNISGGQTVASVVGVETFVDVNQTLAGSLAATAVGNNGTPTINLAGTASGDLVLDYMSGQLNAGGTTTATVGAGQGQIYNAKSPGAPLNADDLVATSSSEPSTGATVTMSWTLSSSQRWSILVSSLRKATTDVEITGYASPDLLDGTPTQVTYTFVVTAHSSGANNVNFSDTLPAGLTIVSATTTQGTCTAAATTSCSLGSLLDAGDTATIKLVALTSNGGIATAYNDTATISIGTTDTNSANNTATVQVLTQNHVCANPGKDGAGGTITGSVNTYFPGTANAAVGAKSITLGTARGATPIAIGDLLLVIQMQDASISSVNDDRYGDGAGTGGTGTAGSGSSALNNAGRYEYVVATNAVAVAGGTLNFNAAGASNGLIYAYTNAAAVAGTSGQRRYQVIRVPQYSTATLSPGTTALAWNGTTGGVLAIDTAGTITMGSNAGTGTVATTNGSDTVTGTATAFTSQIHSGDKITITGEGTRVVRYVTSNTQLILTTDATTTGTGRTFTVPNISVSGLGFRPGGAVQQGGGAGALTDYRTPAATATNASKGEGIAGTPRFLFNGTATLTDTAIDGYPNGSSARGAPGNAGGGGTDGNPGSNDDNSGGGGGGNAGAGGNGGNAWNTAAPVGGFGGVFEAPSTTRFIMGGGGGAGTTNNGTSEGTIQLGNGVNSSGAAGGGIVIIRANAIAGTGTISANGSIALEVGNDAGGGGGAGGTVVIDTVFGTLTGLTVSAKGGDGGSAWLVQGNTGYPSERHGPGGGGGGGAIYLASAAGSTDVTGGINGVTTDDLDNFGASPGNPGILASPLAVIAGADGGYVCAIADLAVTNTGTPTPVGAGSNITYTQTLTNNGPNAADQVVFTTAIPASATFQSLVVPAGFTCTTPSVGAGGIIRCTAPTMANAATANFTVVVQAHPGTPAGYIISDTDTATSQTNESNYTNNTATTTTPGVTGAGADLGVVITAPATAVANTNIAYTQTVTNGGGSAAANAAFSESTPPGTTFQSLTVPPGWTCITPAVGGTGTITCTRPSLASGASASFPMQVKVNAGVATGTVVPETATVATTTTDSNPLNNTSTANTTIVGAGTADLATTITTLSDPVAPGGLLRFSETVTNNGVVASGATFTQTVPANTTFSSMAVPAGWTCTLPAIGAVAGTNIPCTSTGTVAVGATATFTPVFQVVTGTTSGTAINQTVTVATTGGIVDSIAGNNTATSGATVRATGTADLAITKTDSPDPVGVGQLVTYLLKIVNNGPETATGVAISDPLPGSGAVSFVSASPSQGTCSGTTTITCSIGTLALRATATVTIIVQANTTGTLTNTATVSGTLTDPVSTNNSSTATTTVLAVTLARLRTLSVIQNKTNVKISWQTSFESDNLGFNLYREVGGQRTKINQNLIAGTALTTKRENLKSGHSYNFRDKLDSATAFAQYYLEDVDLAGNRTLHGPTSSVAGAVDDAFANAAPLPGLGANGSVLASPPGIGVYRTTTLPKATARQTKQQLDLAGATALKIYVSQEGWYHITRSEMVAAGYDPGQNSNALFLYTNGTEQPMQVLDGGDGRFDPADAIEFYGTTVDTISTGARTYWLRSEPGSGSRIRKTTINGGDPATASVAFNYERDDRSVFFAALTSNGDEDNFFGPVISGTPTTQQISVASIDSSSSQNASIEITIQGGTEQTVHSVAASINGHTLGTLTVINQVEQAFTLPFPPSWLHDGDNALTLTGLNGDNDISLLARTRLTYQHLLRADGGALQTVLPGLRAASVSGFSTASIRAVDVTNTQSPVELQTSVRSTSDGYAATFTPGDSGNRTILVFEASRILTPAEMGANAPSAWASLPKSSTGDLLIITNNAFKIQATTLKGVRDPQGIATSVVDVEDLYDEYNFGMRDPSAIRSFLQSTTFWRRMPKYVLLVGDSSIDPRNYLGLGAVDFMPTRLVATSYLKTASDDWFADFDGDGIAEMAVGRIPVRTTAEASLIFGRITSRGTPTGSWASTALMVADQPDGYDFAGVASSLRALLPAGVSSSTIDVAHSGNPAADIINGLNQGQLIVDYIGHGSVEIWGSSTFQSSTAQTLTNGARLPFVVDMTCLNGYFHDLYTESLAEALLKSANGGAIAVWASSTLTQPDQQAIMNRELYRQLFGAKGTIGDAINKAKRATTDIDVRRSWILFGDPSMTLR